MRKRGRKNWRQKRDPVESITTLPNTQTYIGQTPASLAIDIHYSYLFLVERWNWDRFVKLCSFLKMTPCEVASLVLLPHRYVERYEKGGTLPLPDAHARSVAFHLTLLEAHVMRGLTEDIIDNPYPDLRNDPNNLRTA